MSKKTIVLAILLSFAISGIAHTTSTITPTDIVVFVPGILGSNLQDSHGRIVWGNLTQMVSRFEELELKPLPNQSQLTSNDILKSVSILGPLKISEYSGLLDSLAEIGYIRNKNLFLFPYDWRQSNFDTAVKLKNFIEKTPAFEGKQVTIIAHSMGGLVSRIYIQRYGGDKRVTKLITLGTPYLGSPEALRMLLDGLGPFENPFIGGRLKAIQVISSFPSIYELLPTYENCCILGGPEDKDRTPVDVTDFQTWEKLGWLSSIPNRIDLVKKSLARTRDLADLISQPIPPSVRTYMIVGDLFQTTARVYLNKDGSPKEWVPYNRGDGTVPLRSAMANSEDNAEAAIQRHGTIFNDDHVRVRLKYLLTRDEWWEKYAFTPLTGYVRTVPDETLVSIGGIDINNRTPFLSPGGLATIDITLFDQKNKPVSSVAVEGWLLLSDKSKKPLSIAEDADGIYHATIIIPSDPGIYAILVNVPGIGSFEDFIVVLEDQNAKKHGAKYE